MLSLAGGQPRGWAGSSSGPSEGSDPWALAGVPVLLVAHEGPVVAQDVHGVLPVPAGAAVVLEAGLEADRERHWSPAAVGQHPGVFKDATGFYFHRE